MASDTNRPNPEFPDAGNADSDLYVATRGK